MNIRNSHPFIIREVVELGARTRAQMDQYDDDFRLQPRKLFASLISSIRQHLAEYDVTYPAGQSAHIQFCLYHIESYLDFVNNVQVTSDGQRRNLYIALCGMMWAVLDRVDNPNDQPFAQTILRILCEHRVQKSDALLEYNRFYDFYRAQLPVVIFPNVLLALQTCFEQAKSRLEVEISYDRYNHSFACIELKRKAKALLQEVVNYKASCELRKQSFDYKLYTSILSNTQQLMANPQNDRLKLDYDYLMDQNRQGAPSSKCMIAGAMLAFVGALTVAGTFLAEAVTACASTAVTMPLKIAGLVSMYAGLSLFSFSQPYGTKSAMRTFRDEVDCSNNRQRTSPEVQQRLDERMPLLFGARFG